MKIVSDRMIIEQITLDECEPGDKIEFHWTTTIHIHDRVELLKIKPISKNKVQIKYRSLTTWRGRVNTVKKVDLIGGAMVERTREADARDRVDSKECEIEILP
jgi:hypothetical protein